MKLNETSFVFKTKINLDADTWIEVREPTMLEFRKFNSNGNASEQMESARKIIPDCIIGSNLETDDGETAKGAEVWRVIEPSASLATRVLNDWLLAIPFRVDEKAKASN